MPCSRTWPLEGGMQVRRHRPILVWVIGQRFSRTMIPNSYWTAIDAMWNLYPHRCNPLFLHLRHHRDAKDGTSALDIASIDIGGGAEYCHGTRTCGEWIWESRMFTTGSLHSSSSCLVGAGNTIGRASFVILLV
jgi:hypothetical protein